MSRTLLITGLKPGVNESSLFGLLRQIYSAMLLAEPRDLNLPAGANELNIIRNRKLAPRFSAYEEHERGSIKAHGRKLRRVVYRWNGRFYSRIN